MTTASWLCILLAVATASDGTVRQQPLGLSRRSDGVLIKDWDYSSFGAEYAPPDHVLRLGSGLNSRSGGYASPNDLTFSDLKFYRYKDETQPQVTGMEPSSGSGSVAHGS